MAFRFSLATLMRIRAIAEEREERLLCDILDRIARTRQALAELALQRLSLFQFRDALLQHKISAAELLGVDQGVLLLEMQRQDYNQQLVSLELRRSEQMKVYQAAHRNHEMLAGMREEQFEQFLGEQRRQEQTMMDDNFSARRPRV